MTRSLSSAMSRRTVLVVSLSLLAGCAPTRMAVPADLLREGDRFPVEGRRSLTLAEEVRFGTWSVDDVDRDAKVTQTFDFMSNTDVKDAQDYVLDVKDSNGPTWHVQCRSTSLKKTLRGPKALGGVVQQDRNDAALACTLKATAPDANAWRLEAIGKSDRALQGRLTQGEVAIEVRGSHAAAGTDLEGPQTTGYLLLVDGLPVGAVEVINAGSVVLARSLEPARRRALAALSASLLVYRDPRDLPRTGSPAPPARPRRR